MLADGPAVLGFADWPPTTRPLTRQGFVDTARLKSALTDARAEAESCLTSLDSADESEVSELRTQLQEAREAANSCLVQMSTAPSNDEVWMRAVTTQIEIGRLRAAAAACDPRAVEQGRAAAVQSALARANAASAGVVESLFARARAAEVRAHRAQGNVGQLQVQTVARTKPAGSATPARVRGVRCAQAAAAELTARVRTLESAGSEATSAVFDRAVSVRPSGAASPPLRPTRPVVLPCIRANPLGRPAALCNRCSQAFVDQAQLKSALADAQSEAETCIAVLSADAVTEGGAAGSADVAELRRQLQDARDAANACLVQMGTAAPDDQVRGNEWREGL